MCDFPSWIVDKNGQAWWLTDKDIKAYNDEHPLDPLSKYDSAGHAAITRVLGIMGEHKEGWIKDIPAEFVKDIIEGKCNIAMGDNKIKVTRSNGNVYAVATVACGCKKYFKNGRLHRGGGKPADVCCDSLRKNRCLSSYWIDGTRVTKATRVKA